jgi:hypothetical protein
MEKLKVKLGGKISSKDEEQIVRVYYTAIEMNTIE